MQSTQWHSSFIIISIISIRTKVQTLKKTVQRYKL